jgi:hypothetical protein
MPIFKTCREGTMRAPPGIGAKETVAVAKTLDSGRKWSLAVSAAAAKIRQLWLFDHRRAPEDDVDPRAGIALDLGARWTAKDDLAVVIGVLPAVRALIAAAVLSCKMATALPPPEPVDVDDAPALPPRFVLWGAGVDASLQAIVEDANAKARIQVRMTRLPSAKCSGEFGRCMRSTLAFVTSTTDAS